MTDNHLPGNLFSIAIPKKDKPTKIYGLLHRDKPDILYGILIEEDEDMSRLNCRAGWWKALVEGKKRHINVNSEFYKTERYVYES